MAALGSVRRLGGERGGRVRAVGWRWAALAALVGLALPALPTAAVAATGDPIVPDAHTVVLDHLDGSTTGAAYGGLTYAESIDGLGQAGVFGSGIYVKYGLPGWFTGQGTVEMWVRPDVLPDYGFEIMNINWFDATLPPPTGGNIFGLGVYEENDQGMPPYSPQTGFWFEGRAFGDRSVVAGEWTHLAVSWGPAGTKLYIDGVASTGPSVPGTPTFAGMNWAYLNSWGLLPTSGLMDELQISDVQRSDEEILAHATLRDTTPPTVTLTSPTDGAAYVLGSAVVADYTCADTDSGVAACDGTVADGAAVDTSSVGPHTFTVDAADVAGNTTSVTHAYDVVYDVSGFYPPVANPPAGNDRKAGSAVPVSFGLGGDQGLGVLAAGSPRSQEVSCATGQPMGADAPAVSARPSPLTYSVSSGRYQFVWKTERTWSGTCRRLDVTLVDGTTHSALFDFR